MYAGFRLLILSGRSALCLILLLLATTALAAAVNTVVRPVLAHGPGSLRDPMVLDTVGHWAGQVSSHVSKLPSKPTLWLGETGSAQVGGEPGVSGRWATALWWLDQLGQVATLGHAVQCRQTLCGADYGLIEEKTHLPTVRNLHSPTHHSFLLLSFAILLVSQCMLLCLRCPSRCAHLDGPQLSSLQHMA